MSLSKLILKDPASSGDSSFTAGIPFTLPKSGRQVQFKLRYLPRETFRQFTLSCQGVEFDAVAKRPIQKTNNDKLLSLVIRETVLGIEGLRYSDLFELIPVDQKALESELEDKGGVDSEISFNPSSTDSIDFLVGVAKANSYFESWLTDQVLDLNNFQVVPEDVQSKNSGSSPVLS